MLPDLRRRGIGSRLLDAAEELIAARWPLAASLARIGVGLDPDYGAAQRLYVERGYVPDGRGLAWRGQPVAYGQSVTVDDDLALYFTRELRR